MNRVGGVLVASIAVAAFMFFLLPTQPTAVATKTASYTSDSGSDLTPIEVYCAASNRSVMEKIRLAYEQETGQSVQVQYGASQSLLASIEIAGQADLYIPADDSYLQLARSKSLLTEVYPLAQMRVILAVRKGNPKQIQSLKDLVRDDVRLVQANPDAAAVGKLTREALQKTGEWSEIDQATKAYGVSVTDVANDLKLGSADAGFIYDVMLKTYLDLEAIAVPQIAEVTAFVAVGVIKHKEPTRPAVTQFLRYLQATDRGLKHYADEGFKVVAGRNWAQDR